MLNKVLNSKILNFFRLIEVPEDRGSKVEGEQDQGELLDFVLGESRPFPIEILFGDKVIIISLLTLSTSSTVVDPILK